MRVLHGHSLKEFFKDLRSEISEDNLPNGAAALAYYLMLALFPAMIFLLSLLPYLPIENLDGQIMDLMRQAMPPDAARVFSDTVTEITKNKQGGLLSVGALLTLWAASSGMYAVMHQLNITYDVKEGRPFWKVRGTAILMTFSFGALLVGAFTLIVFGDAIQGWLASALGESWVLTSAFQLLRWGIILGALLLAFAVMYYLGPDVEQKFKYITPGAVFGVTLLIAASLAIKLYVTNFSDYSKTYGSLGAVIVLMLWLNVAGLVILLGSEVNALIEHYAPDGKDKGEKREPPEPVKAA